MKWQSGRRSSNVEDRRGMSGGRAGLGGGAVLAVVVISYFLGIDPRMLLGVAEQVTPGAKQQQGGAPPATDEQAQFIATILGDTEDTWNQLFNSVGRPYQPARLILFSNGVQSACGFAESAVGPFYCPGDQQVYIDLDFFAEMQRSLGGGGDFAEAYVVAHEVGHHVQTLLGISERVMQARQQGQDVEGATGLLVRQELQADCYAGVWGFHGQQRYQWLEPGDLEEALTTASAIGDDTLQRRGQGRVVPDSFTHGSSEQRVRWFRRGFESGDLRVCDTFAADRL